MTVPVSLATLTTPTTPDEALQLELTACTELGLDTTAWDPVSMVPTLLNVNATIASGLSQEVAYIAQGGYASTAAAMVDATGTPITSWMQLRATDQYGITPQPATYASGPVPYTNTSGSSYSYGPFAPLHAQNPSTGANYTSTGSGSVSPGTGTVSFQADVAGSASTSAAGVILTLTTPKNGVTLNTLTVSLVGSNEESNAALLARGQNKLATLTPIQSTDVPGPVVGGSVGAFKYVATSIPQASVASNVPPYAVTSVITDCQAFVSTSSGVANVVIRNSGGAPSPTDVAVIQNAVLQLCTQDGINPVVVAASPVTVLVTGTIYIGRNSAVSGLTAQTNALDALAIYFASLPIGGVSTSQSNVVPYSDVIRVTFDANNGTVDVVLTSLSADTYIGQLGIPVLSPLSSFSLVIV